MLTELMLSQILFAVDPAAVAAAPVAQAPAPQTQEFGLTSQVRHDPAFDFYGPRMGNWSLTLGGSGFTDRSFGQSTFGLNFSIGHFFTDELEFSFRQGLDFTDVGGSNLLATSALGLDFHFVGGPLVPFIGGQVGYVYGDQRDTWMVGPEGGLKWFVKPETYLFGQAEYQHFFRRLRAPDESSRRGQFVFKVGVGFLW